MKIVLPGGTGNVGRVLAHTFADQGHEVVVLSRSAASIGRARVVSWDGSTVGDWAREIDGADVVVNLAGRTVNCRYTEENLREMFESRVRSARAVGEAIGAAASPPRLWLQMSTATIYAHRFDEPNDEATGILGGDETDTPAYWRYSVQIAKWWERAQTEADTPRTRKVALRAAMVMSPDRGGIFDTMLKLVRLGLSGNAAGGRQFVSWIHEADFLRAIRALVEREDLTGPVNLAAPGPLPYADFMGALRDAWGTRFGLPATRWMLEIGAWALGTDTELVLKSRRVVPGRLLAEGFTFEFPEWRAAASDLVARWRAAVSQA